MRTNRGFTLVELIVVISIITILTTIATLSWKRMSMKTAVEGQIKTVHADMMSVRLDALYTKGSRSVVFSGKNFSIYSSGATTGTPVSTRTFKYKFFPAAATTVTFNSSGMTNGTQVTVCVNAYDEAVLFEITDAYVDSLVISQARLNLGKRAEGGACDTDGVTQR